MKKLLFRRLLTTILFSTLTIHLQAQLTRFVKQGGTGDGSNWANASGDLPAMMNAAANGGTVYVAGGTYYPTTTTDRTLPFLVPQAGNIKLIGGYDAATGMRNILAHPSILSGDIGVPGNDVDNSLHVLVIAGTDAGADSIIIDGFTITKGRATGSGASSSYNGSSISSTYGGGICVATGGKVAIRNTTIIDNKAVFAGGGMFNEQAAPLIEDCSIGNNEVIYDFRYAIYQYYGGGGMYNKDAEPQVTRTTIKGNKGLNGGGVLNYDLAAKYDHCLFEGNMAVNGGNGGATYNFSPGGGAQPRPVFTHCVFTSNNAGLGGAGYDNGLSSPTYNNCVFYGNSATGSSGGGYGSCFYGAEGDLLNINNCVFYGNAASANFTIRIASGSLRVMNSIMQGNTAGTEIYIEGRFTNNSQIGHSLISSVGAGAGVTINYLAGNLIGPYDPLFTNTANAIGADGIWGTADDGLQLTMNSPAVNTGSNDLTPAPITTDMAGAPRIQAGTVDMGAYESSISVNCGFSTLYVDGSRASSGSGGSWSNAFKTLSEAMERARHCSTVTTILVAGGTYYPTGDQNGTDRDSTFLVPQRGGLKLYGGYPAGGGARDPFAYPTILSGDIGAPGNAHDNSYHILVITETLPGADSVVIDGFIITGANANGNSYYYHNVLTPQHAGGGILLRNNINAGTAIAIRNCAITGNKADLSGAGIYALASSLLINNCVIANNTALQDGGGAFYTGPASSRMVNCLLTGNSAQNGAAIYNNNTSLTIISTTVAGNTASVQAGGLYNTGTASTNITNTIFWSNGTNAMHNAAALTITYSNIEQGSGVYTGTGNINAGPLFVNPSNPAGGDGKWRTADDGLKLQGGSPGINAGTPDVSGLSLNPVDLQGTERILLDNIDMGAYETPFISCSGAGSVLYVDGSVSQSGNGSSWANAFKSLAIALEALQGCPDIKTIQIARGTYYPSASSNRDDAFIIPRRGDIKLYGGYPAGGGVRDVAGNPTILSGDIGATNNNSDNSYHVMAITNIHADADSVVLDGLTFTGAQANGSGGFTINEATVQRSTGGGLVVTNTNGNTKILVRNCRFENNNASQGAGIYTAAAAPVIVDSYLQGNTSSDNGGGMSNYNGATPTLINVLISGNKAGFAGAVFNDNSSPTFIHTTIADNFANGDAGGLYNRYNNTHVRFFNSIIYGNSRPDGVASNIFNVSGGNTSLAHSLIESPSASWDASFGTNNGNNLFVDPLFTARVAPTSANTPTIAGDYRLQPASPAIDAGDNTAIPSGIAGDMVQASRVQHSWADMGAFESTHFNCAMFTATTTQTDVLCRGAATAIASVTLSRGVAPYTYSWSNGATTAAINNIIAGQYVCTITDANGCSITKSFTITQPADSLTATPVITAVRCFGASNGAASVTLSGGAAPYAYNWSNGATTPTIGQLAAGSYNVALTDANGCHASAAFTIDEPAALTVVTGKTDILCFNGTTGAASVTVSGGTTPYTYSWSNGGTTNAISDVAAGTYTSAITDANGCSVVESFTITRPAVALAATPSQTNIGCFNANTGKASLAVSGGTTPYSYSWSNGGTASFIDQVPAGTYTCTVTDANGCTILQTFTLTEPAAMTVQVLSTSGVYCAGGTTGATAIAAHGGVTPYAYLWSNGSNTAVVDGLAAGNYTCVVTDGNGCTVNALVTIAQNTFSGNKIYVDSAVVVPGNGSSWAGAFRYMSEALAAAGCAGVDSILVAKGTYYPTGLQAGGNRDHTFLIPQNGGLKIYGGYPSGGGVRDVAANATVLSGDIAHPGDGDNSYHVMVIAGLAAGADSVVVDGFTFTRGYANGSGVLPYNGVDVDKWNGSAMYIGKNTLTAGKIAIRHCQFTGNVAWSEGGAIYIEQSSPAITHCRFADNTAFLNGGGICSRSASDPRITLCTFENNQVMNLGGAIYNGTTTRPIIDQTRFVRNNGMSGGAIANEGASPVMTNCSIAGNSADNAGGAIYNSNATTAIINTFITGNATNMNGFGSALTNVNNSRVTITNCTISSNNGWWGAVPVNNDASQLSITNSIVYGHNQEIRDVNAAATQVNYSLVEYWTGGGTGNLSNTADPVFIAWGSGTGAFTNGDYRISACSPAINAGTSDTTGLNLPLVEATSGLPRIQLGRIDIGAHEANSFTNDNATTIPQTPVTTAAYQLRDNTTWYGTDCNTLLAVITGSGNNPVSGNTQVSVNQNPALLPGAISRYYDIEPENNPGGSSGTITLFYTQAEFDAYNTANNPGIRLPLPDKDDPQVADMIANIRIRKMSGGVETIIVPHTVHWNDGAQRWELTFDVSSFSTFYVFTQINATLPLRFISLTAREENCRATIAWTTAEEIAVSHFEVEHSADGRSWSLATRTTARNTITENNYSVSLNIPVAVNFYRLKMVDINGKTTYSKMATLAASTDCIGQTIKLYPNPASDMVYLERAKAGDSYQFYDQTGRVVLRGTVKKTVQPIDIRQLSPGLYTVIVMDSKGTIRTRKLIRQ